MTRRMLWLSVLVAAVLVAAPAAAAGDYSTSASGSSDGPAASPNDWLNVTRQGAGNWYINASAWLGNATGSLSFSNVKNLTIDASGWIDDAMRAAQTVDATITIKMESNLAQLNFTIKGVPSVESIKRNGVALPYAYSSTTGILTMTVNFTAVNITMDFVNAVNSAISSLLPVVVALMTLVVVVSVVSGLFGLIIGKLNSLGKLMGRK